MKAILINAKTKEVKEISSSISDKLSAEASYCIYWER